MEEYILKVLDEQPDGFIVPNQMEFYNNNIHEFFQAIQRLIDKGVLRKRNCDGLAYEYNRCMTVADIKNLPKEFNFKSNINTYGIIYHAVEQKHGYRVTCNVGTSEWDFSKEEMHRNLLSGDYEIISQ